MMMKQKKWVDQVLALFLDGVESSNRRAEGYVRCEVRDVSEERVQCCRVAHGLCVTRCTWLRPV